MGEQVNVVPRSEKEEKASNKISYHAISLQEQNRSLLYTESRYGIQIRGVYRTTIVRGKLMAWTEDVLFV